MAFKSWSRVVFALLLLSRAASSLVINNLREKSHQRSAKNNPVQRKVFGRITPVMVSMAAEPSKEMKPKASAAKSADPYEKTLMEKIEVGTYLTLWFIISAAYNIYNKKALNLIDLPWFVATIQMGAGLLIFIPLWLLHLREAPSKNVKDLMNIFSSLKSVAFYQTLTHIAGVIALGAGAVSFTQVVKASEPVFTAAISAVFLQQFLPWQAYAALVPVCAGVALASTKELSFSWYCLMAGVMSNIFAAARGVFGKKQMSGKSGPEKSLSPENYYAVLTILSFILLIPAAGIVEGKGIVDVVRGTTEYLKGGKDILKTITSIFLVSSGKPASPAENSFHGFMYALVSGLMFYLYNEVSFRALNKVHPITHAVANTTKRVVIILSSVLMFRNPMTPTGILGSAMAVMGVFLYSLCQQYYKPKKN